MIIVFGNESAIIPDETEINLFERDRKKQIVWRQPNTKVSYIV